MLAADARRLVLRVPKTLGRHPALKLSHPGCQIIGVEEARQLSHLLTNCAQTLRRGLKICCASHDKRR